MKFEIMGICTLLLAASVWANPTESALDAERARCSALLRGDAPALRALLAEDYHYIHSTGKEETRDDVLQGITTGKLAYERLDVAGLKVQPVTADVVVVTGTMDQRKLSGGKWNDAKLLIHAVWRRESGAWRQVSLQTVLVSAPRL